MEPSWKTIKLRKLRSGPLAGRVLLYANTPLIVSPKDTDGVVPDGISPKMGGYRNAMDAATDVDVVKFVEETQALEFAEARYARGKRDGMVASGRVEYGCNPCYTHGKRTGLEEGAAERDLLQTALQESARREERLTETVESLRTALGQEESKSAGLATSFNEVAEIERDLRSALAAKAHDCDLSKRRNVELNDEVKRLKTELHKASETRCQSCYNSGRSDGKMEAERVARPRMGIDPAASGGWINLSSIFADLPIPRVPAPSPEDRLSDEDKAALAYGRARLMQMRFKKQAHEGQIEVNEDMSAAAQALRKIVDAAG